MPLSSLGDKWSTFLTDVDGRLPEVIELHCLGGFVAAMHYGLPRPTADLDYFQIVPMAAQAMLQKLAGEGSSLARKPWALPSARPDS